MATTIATIDANGLTFRVREAGSTGEPVLLLHGFPETSHMWLPLLDRLEADGYRALGPDQRGYSPGARPGSLDQYNYSHFARDAVAIADAAGFERFHLVGHDWGACAGWAVVDLFPERIASWTALSVPHMAAFAGAIHSHPDQQARSQYINFFRQEGVAEAGLSADDNSMLKNIWSQSPPEQLAEYLDIFGKGALTGGLNWYRGTQGIHPGADPEVTFGPVATPTLFVWGNKDSAIGRVGVDDTPHRMTGPYRFVELDAGHWLIQEETERVIEETMSHIKGNPIS